MQRIHAIQQTLSTNFTGEEYDVLEHIKSAPADPILGITLAFKADTDPSKVDLGVGAYRTDAGKPYVFDVVRQTDLELAQDQSLDKEYLPIDGLAVFNKRAQELIFGADSPLIKEGRVVTLQALSGTGALRVGFEFIKTFLTNDVLISNPTWGNHQTIINNVGLKYTEYPYYDPKTKGLDFKGLISTLSQTRRGSVVLLHACAHNPTGIDPTPEQWNEIAAVLKKRGLIPFLDSAYQGYASGCVDKDAYAIRKFASEGFQMIVAQSFAKNMGLYGERCGAIHFVASNKDIAQRVLSQAKIVVRAMYSNPPIHASRLCGKILDDPKKRQQWLTELKGLADRILTMRSLLRSELEKLNVPGNWKIITDQIGMFSYTGLTPEQCEILTKKHHIYLLKNGRISMAGVNTRNVVYIAKAIADAVASTTK